MLNNLRLLKEDLSPIRLHLSLEDDYLSSRQRTMLKRYGESFSGSTITRDVLVPCDIPLHNLHYAIQKLYGWQNSHLRRFQLPEEIYNRLTGGTVKGWSELVGELFQPPSEFETDLFWDDDYEDGSFNGWLKKKYKGPYRYHGHYEEPDVAKEDMKSLLDRFQKVEVLAPFTFDLGDNASKGKNKTEVLRCAPMIDLTLRELNDSIYMDCDQESLLERLKIADVLGIYGEEIRTDKRFPTTDVLYYNYDFGDNWIVKITRLQNFDDLLEQNFIEADEINEAITKVITNYIPVCICANGLPVLDDVGGLSGFSDMLETIYESDDKEEKSNMKAWATSMGWSSKKVNPKSIL